MVSGPWVGTTGNPIDHAEESESGGAGADADFGSAGALHVGDQVLHEMDVVLLSSVDALAERRRQRMVLVEHDCDFAIAGAKDYFDMKPDECARAVLRDREMPRAPD